MGLGGAGLTLASEFCRIGAKVIGLDCDPKKAQMAECEICSERFIASDDFSAARSADMIVLCVDKEDHSGTRAELLRVTERLALHIERGQVIVVDTIVGEESVRKKLCSALERGSALEEGSEFTFFFAPQYERTSSPPARAAAIVLLWEVKTNAPLPPAHADPGLDSQNLSRSELPQSGHINPRARLDQKLAERLVHIAALCDIIVIVCALLCGFWLRFHTGMVEVGTRGEVNLRDYVGYIAIGALSLIVVLSYLQVYDTRTLLQVRRINARMLKAGAFWFVAFISISLGIDFQPPISRIFALVGSATTMCGLVAWRTCFHTYLRKPSLARSLRQRVLFIGWTAESRHLAESFAADRCSAYTVAGYISGPSTSKSHIDDQFAKHFHNIGDLASILQRESVDTVILAHCDFPKKEILHIATVCERELVAFKVIPSYFRILVSGLHLETMNGTPILGISRLPLDLRLNVFIKRLLDVVGAVVGLLLSAPVIVLIGSLVRWESPGPVIYRQRRIGKKGRSFYMFKIRSMHLCAEEGGKVGWTVKNDPRRLKIGVFIRRWNIDELPQFWNVLKGEMSLVGPRPERPELVANFKCDIPYYQSRHNIKPGMTGWAQVKGLRGDTDLRERITCDLFYLENWSFLLDLQVLIMTFFRNKSAC